MGRVQGINENTSQMVIDAQKAPGTGAVMTVPYQAANRQELAGYKAGDKVRGQVVVSKERTYVESVQPAAVSASP